MEAKSFSNLNSRAYDKEKGRYLIVWNYDGENVIDFVVTREIDAVCFSGNHKFPFPKQDLKSLLSKDAVFHQYGYSYSLFIFFTFQIFILLFFRKLACRVNMIRKDHFISIGELDILCTPLVQDERDRKITALEIRLKNLENTCITQISRIEPKEISEKITLHQVNRTINFEVNECPDNAKAMIIGIQYYHGSSGSNTHGYLKYKMYQQNHSNNAVISPSVQHFNWYHLF